MRRRFGIPGVELGDDRHTLSPLLFLAPTLMLGPLLRSLLPGHLHQSSVSPAADGWPWVVPDDRRGGQLSLARLWQTCTKFTAPSSTGAAITTSEGQRRRPRPKIAA